jgi:hypothetical protein
MFYVIVILAAIFAMPSKADEIVNGVEDRIKIQELIYVYAYTFDAKDCVS